MRAIFLGLPVVGLLSTAPAFAQPACLVAAQVWSWKHLDRRTLIVEDTVHRRFKVTLYGYCPGVDFNTGAAFLSQGNSQLDCLRRGDVVIHRGYGLGNRCPIKSVELYTASKANDAATAQ